MRSVLNAVVLVVLAALYFASAKLGLRLAFVNESASAVWPPTGIAIAAMVLVCLCAHIAEIAIFALGMFIGAALDGDLALALEGWSAGNLDLWYYSAAFYTSLGAERPSATGLRLFVACEALTGLILITWTASFLFLLMQNAWGQEPTDQERQK